MSNFKNKVVYEVYIKSFLDSNNDGIGDIRGVINKLDYIKQIGINCLWLTPFYESPMKDEGYDISNYMKVNKDFGTLADVKELIEKADKMNIDVMADFVLNHTSDQHEWFKKALAGDKYYQDFYFFEDKPRTKWIPRFRGDSCWEYVSSLDKYYLHLYDVSQPDLNWDNPNVRNEMFKVVDKWLKLGIRSYKFDVLYLISKPTYNNWKPDGRIPCAEAVRDGKHVHKYIKELMHKIKTKYPNTYSVGEMSFSTIDECIKYSKPSSKEVDIVMTGKFLYAYSDKNGDSLLDKAPFDNSIYIQNIKNWVTKMQAGGGWLSIFTANHDSPRSVNRIGSLKHWSKSAKAIILQTIALQGTPFFTQGEEIGMLNPGYKNVSYYVDMKSVTLVNSPEGIATPVSKLIKALDDNSRDPGRNPMIWNSSKNGGWSNSNNPWRKTMPWLIEKVNLEKQKEDKNSIFSFFKKAVSLRVSDKILQEGKITFNEEDKNILSFIREHSNKKYLCVFNLSEKSIPIKNMFKIKKLILSNINSLPKTISSVGAWDAFVAEI